MSVSPWFAQTDMAETAMLRHERHPSLTIPLLAWLVPQILSLLLSAARIPLSAHPPRPIESIALTQLAIVQIIFASLLAPLLFRSIASAFAVLLTSGPMLQLAGILCSATIAECATHFTVVACWIIAVSALSLTLSPTSVTATATLWSLGGVVLAYLNAEFSGASLPRAFFGPVVLVTSQPHIAWGTVGMIPACALVMAGCVHGARRSNPREKASVGENGNSAEAREV